jgi:hypothetical protein
VRGGAGGKVMRENEPVLLVLSVCDGEIILEKRQWHQSMGMRGSICYTSFATIILE